MIRKLTLSVEDETIELARRIASSTGVSISKMFESFIYKQKNKKSVTAKLRPSIAELHGRYKKSPITNKKQIRREIVKNHG